MNVIYSLFFCRCVWLWRLDVQWCWDPEEEAAGYGEAETPDAGQSEPQSSCLIHCYCGDAGWKQVYVYIKSYSVFTTTITISHYKQQIFAVLWIIMGVF